MDYSNLNKFARQQKAMIDSERKEISRLRSIGAYPQCLSMPIGIQFELTAKCNLACKHCYNRSEAKNTDAMHVSDWIKLVADGCE